MKIETGLKSNVLSWNFPKILPPLLKVTWVHFFSDQILQMIWSLYQKFSFVADLSWVSGMYYLKNWLKANWNNSFLFFANFLTYYCWSRNHSEKCPSFRVILQSFIRVQPDATLQVPISYGVVFWNSKRRQKMSFGAPRICGCCFEN